MRFRAINIIDNKKVRITHVRKFIYFYLIWINKDLPRTNNVAEGWNNAFSVMAGMKRPSIFRFVEILKKDEAIARASIINCLSGHSPPPPKKKFAQRDEAMKRSVHNYLKAEKANKEAVEQVTDNGNVSVDSSDDEIEENQCSQGKSSHQIWQKTPTMVLLSAFAQNTRHWFVFFILFGFNTMCASVVVLSIEFQFFVKIARWNKKLPEE